MNHSTTSTINENPLEEQDIGPRKIGNARLILKTIVGIIGGISGTMVILIVYMLASSLFSVQMDLTTGLTLLQLYIVLVMVVMATLVGNLVSLTFFYLIDRDKYQKLTPLITQGFIFNLLIFIFSIPLYFFIRGTGTDTLVYIISVHFLLSAFITSVMMEILSSSTYVLVGLYGNTIGILAALVVNLILFQFNKDTSVSAFFLFLTMPITWGSLGFCQSITEMLYRWFYDVYGFDFLNKEEYDDYEEERVISTDDEEEDDEDEEEK
jgi:hypothetical protein